MIPVFRCIVIETLISQYCGMFSAAGVARYIRFREPRALEAWECRQARKRGKIVINGRTFQGKIRATASHSMFLAGRLDDESRCEIGIVTFPDGKMLNGQAAQGLYEITLREVCSFFNKNFNVIFIFMYGTYQGKSFLRWLVYMWVRAEGRFDDKGI
jgi:hypothetical protein